MFTSAEGIQKIYNGFKTMPDENEGLFMGLELEVANKLLKKRCWSDTAELSKYQADTINLVQEYLGKDNTAIKPEHADGFEIITAPATLRYHREVLWNRIDELKDNITGEEANSGYGVHVHFNRNYVSDLALAKILYFYHAPDNNAFLTGLAGRIVGPKNCYNLALKKLYRPLIPRDTIDDSGTVGRRGGAATAKTRTGLTIEVRIFQSIVDRHHLLKCLDLVSAVIEWASVVGYKEEDFVHSNFVQWLVSNNKKNKYPDLYVELIKLSHIAEVEEEPIVEEAEDTITVRLEEIETPYGPVQMIRNTLSGRFLGRRRKVAA